MALTGIQLLNLKLIPAICLDYIDSDLISVDVWPQSSIEKLDKIQVIEMCQSNNLFPPKTTKHTTVYDLPPIMVRLENLL